MPETNATASAMVKKSPVTPPVVGKEINVINADKMNMKDLVDKEAFHSVYTLGEVLGRGNYSVVKQGRKKNSDDKTVYAVKCISESSLTHEDRVALKIETALLREIDHPNIIKMLGFFEEPKEKMFYIVTEFVGGGELFDRIIEKEFYSEEDARKLVVTLASALKYCHERGIVHRDLKPENILLSSKDDDNIVKIADFGFAKQYDTSSDDSLTTSCGTPGYVAPEILNGKKYGKEVDMWSFGVIIYILLCGYPPFHHDNQKELFKMIRAANYKFDEEYWKSVSEDAKDLIRNLLIVDREKRFTIEQLMAHKWITSADGYSETDISQAKVNLGNYQKSLRFKAGVKAVMFQNKLNKMVQGAKEPKDDVTSASDVATEIVKSE